MLFALLSLASPAFAQNDSHIASIIDTPQPGWAINRSLLWFSGWAVHCQSGQQPQQLHVFYVADSGEWVPLTLWYRTGSLMQILRGYRPDVTPWVPFWCPNGEGGNASDYSGFVFNVEPAPPLGERTFKIMWSDRTGAKIDSVTVILQ